MKVNVTTSCPRPTSHRGFSLTEVLVVIAIVAFLMAAAAVGMRDLSGSVGLSTAGTILQQQMDLARQLAITHNQYVLVRFLAPMNADPGLEGHFVASMLHRSEAPFVGSDAEFENWINEGRIVPEGRRNAFPNHCVVVDDSSLSPLLAWARNEGLTGAVQHAGQNFHWTGFYFGPDGALLTTLPPGRAYFTVLVDRDILSGLEQLPNNCAVISLDPITGRPRQFRP